MNIVSDFFKNIFLAFCGIFDISFKVSCPGCGSPELIQGEDVVYKEGSTPRHKSDWSDNSRTFRYTYVSFPMATQFTCSTCNEKTYREHWFNYSEWIRTEDPPFKAKPCKYCSQKGKTTGETDSTFYYDWIKGESQFQPSQSINMKCGRCDGKGWYKK